MSKHTVKALALASAEARDVEAHASLARNIRKVGVCVVSVDALARIAERLMRLEELEGLGIDEDVLGDRDRQIEEQGTEIDSLLARIDELERKAGAP